MHIVARLDKKKSELSVIAHGGEFSRELQDLIWQIVESDELKFTFIQDDVVFAKVAPWDWRAIRAAESLMNKVKYDNELERGDDLFSQILEDVRQDGYKATYKRKKKTKEAAQLMTKLGGRVRSRNQKARKAGFVADLTVEQAEAILKAANGKCPNCQKNGFKWHELELAHIEPHRDGGGSTLSNTRALCRPCNRSQGATA